MPETPSSTSETASARGTAWDRRGTGVFTPSGPGLTIGKYMGIGRKKASWTAGTAAETQSSSERVKLWRLSDDTGEETSERMGGETKKTGEGQGANENKKLLDARDGGPGGPGGPMVDRLSESLTKAWDRYRDRSHLEAVPVPVPVAEALALPVRQLADLPIPSTISTRLPGLNRPVVITASLRRYRTLVADGVCTFAPAELVALTAALESGRGTPADVVGWCRKKLEIPGGWKLGAETALGGGGATLESVGLPPVGPYQFFGWTLGRVLQELGGRVVAVELELEDCSTETLWVEGRQDRATASQVVTSGERS